MMYEFQKRGITAKLFEAGSNVGGTWYWNRCVLTYTNTRTISYRNTTTRHFYKYLLSPDIPVHELTARAGFMS